MKVSRILAVSALGLTALAAAAPASAQYRDINPGDGRYRDVNPGDRNYRDRGNNRGSYGYYDNNDINPSSRGYNYNYNNGGYWSRPYYQGGYGGGQKYDYRDGHYVR